MTKLLNEKNYTAIVGNRDKLFFSNKLERTDGLLELESSLEFSNLSVL